MGVPKYEKNIDKYVNTTTFTTKKIVGCVLEKDTPFETSLFEGYEEGVNLWYVNNTGGTNMTAYVVPYYFNHDDSIFLSDLICRGTQYSSAAEMCEAVKAYYHDHITAGFNIDSPAISQFTARGQAAFGTQNGHNICPFMRMAGSKGQTQVGVPFYNASLQIWLQVAVWNGTAWSAPMNGHPLVFGQTSSAAGVTSLADVDRMIEVIFSELAKYELCVGPGATWENTGSGMVLTSYDRNATNYFIMTHNALTTGLGLISKCLLINSANTSNIWTGNGEVDPEDPWEEPDPYEPVPPGPTPPGPVDPTDPVDPVPEPNLPPIGGTSVGIYTVYNPNSSQLRSIANKLWDPTAWDAIKQMFTNPMDAIMGLAIVPVAPVVGNPRDVYLGRYNTQVSVPVVSSDYVNVDCGSVTIPKFYGSYLDHDPYTKYHLYLPYVGEIDINADEITGKTVSIKYHCNVVTGDCVAIVLINNRACYTAMGNIIRQLPLSQTDFTSVIQTAVAAASTMLQSAQSTAAGAERAAAGAATGNATQAMNGGIQAATAALNGVTSTVNTIASAKLNYKHAGKVGQGAAQMAVQKPFFTVTRPNISLPEGIDGARSSSQKRYTGYPANYIDELRNFHGFTIVEEAQLNMLGATDKEIAEATAILKGGVYL